jgi:hypothetical protein
MPSTERKYTPAENKARRLRAAEATVESKTKARDKAVAKVTEAETLKTKAAEAETALKAAVAHRDWLKSMPVDGETPEADETATEDTDVDEDGNPAILPTD